MRPLLLTLLLASALPAIDVGEGAPTPGTRIQFQQAWFRNGFQLLVGEPAGVVRRWGSTGLIQEFLGKSDTDGRAALVKATATDAVAGDGLGVYQVYAGIFSYYSTLGAGTVGFPTMDTQQCPSALCSFQLFDKGYALFFYKSSLFAGQTFQVRAAFYTKWNALAGIAGIGPPVDNEADVTSSKGSTATIQVFTTGTVYSLTSGAVSGSTFGIGGAVYRLYLTQNTHSGALGFPVSDEYNVSSTRRRQDFEGGSVEYTPGSEAELRLPVAAVSLGRYDNAGSVNLNLGDTLQVTAIAYSVNGLELSGRTISWSSTNGRVISVQASGNTVTLTALSGGSASVRASSEGKTSAPLLLFVTAPCCQVGEGAPTAEIQQSFQDALSRARITVSLPNPSAVRRGGAGYYQELTAVGGQKVLVAKSDSSPVAFLVTGDLLAAYLAAGGPGGAIGYPLSESTPTGRQVFVGGALAGSPARLVSGTVLTKWAQLGYETGVAGPPTADPAAFQSVNATSGAAQSFRNGVIHALSSGARRGQAFLVAGTILARYQALGGAAGDLGAPISDEAGAAGVVRQQFENGVIEYVAGGEAQERMNERRPAVTALPATVVAGSRLRLLVSGFPPGSTLRVSVTGRPDFTVSAPNGVYTWESYIPLDAPPGTVTVRAVDTGGSSSAQTSYIVRSLSQARLQVTKVQGEGQIAAPGTVLPKTLRVAVRDESQEPVVGVMVTFAGSPGTQLTPASVTTDESGEAETVMRLPSAPGVALATAEAGGTVVTFGAQAAAVSISNFPAQRAVGSALLGNGKRTIAQKGALLAAASSIVRYYQDRGDVAAGNGLAEPALLNEYLKSLCAFDAQGARICDGFLSSPDSGEQVLNLWRLSEFTANTLDVALEGADLSAVASFVAQGQPVLLALTLTVDATPAGSHFVVVTGVAQDGGLVIHDPSPLLLRTRLSEYLQGFTAAGHLYSGKVGAAVRLLPRAASARRFLLAAVSLSPEAQALAFSIQSAQGPCGATLELPDAAVIGEAVPAGVRVSKLTACEGSQAIYQIAVSGPASGSLTDLTGGGGVRQIGAGFYQASRTTTALEVSPLAPAVNGAVVNAAAAEAGLAPGTLARVAGAGLAGPVGEVTVTVGGQAARIGSANAFQVSFEIPLGLTAGGQLLRLTSPYGTWERSISLQEAAPALFARSAWNQNGTANSGLSPAARGQTITVYATGLGAVVRVNGYDVPQLAVTAALNGVELPISFVGLSSAFPGVYQLNVTIPAGNPPGLDLPLVLHQGSSSSNAAAISLQ